MKHVLRKIVKATPMYPVLRYIVKRHRIRQAIRKIVKVTPMYPVLQYIVKRHRIRRAIRQFWEWSAVDQTRLDFYQQFVTPGDVVFDVGANLGNRAKVFSRLGAVVVAVEPQTACSDFLYSVFKDTANFHLVRKALGASAGQAEMFISNIHMISSMSPDWIRSVKESGRFSQYSWDRKEKVIIDTLDNLIAKYGCPAFVKIDVEGFEDQVVSGLSTPVGAISMEFTPEFMGNTLRCIDHLCRLGDVCFQLSLGESMKFLLPKWETEEEIKRALSQVPSECFGDLYARFNVQQGTAPDGDSAALHSCR